VQNVGSLKSFMRNVLHRTLLSASLSSEFLLLLLRSHKFHCGEPNGDDFVIVE